MLLFVPQWEVCVCGGGGGGGLWVTAVETACELQNKKTADSNLITVQRKKKKKRGHITSDFENPDFGGS